jgi:hypothetical protein
MAGMTLNPVFPLLSSVLWMASVAVTARSACHLAVFAFTSRAWLAGRVYAWQATAFGLIGATLVSAGAWQYGVPFGALAALCAVLWQRERGRVWRQAGVTL